MKKNMFDKIIQKFTSTFNHDQISQCCDSTSQMALKFIYQGMLKSGATLPCFDEVGFKIFSQADEDGILLYIFSLIGTTNKSCVEICAGDGRECNSANLIINHGWNGLLVDGDVKLIEKGREYYRKNQHTYVYPPTFVHAWITKSNVNEVIRSGEFEGDIDLLSIDIDGMDYWIWKSIQIINPRVVVIEYNDIIGPNEAITVPYSDDFNAYVYPTTRGMPNYCGASLAAFVKLAKKLGYRLVGCNRYGYNAFFIKNSIGVQYIPEIPIEKCFTHPKVLWGMKNRFPVVKDFLWEHV